MQVIVYSTGATGCAVVGLPANADIAAVRAKDVPTGAQSIIVDSASLPSADPSTWKIVNAAIAVDATALAAFLITYANGKQWKLATGGFTVTIGGQALTFDTRPESLTLIAGKDARLAKPNPPATVNWQFASGWVSIAAADFDTAAVKIVDFMQATFDTLKAVSGQIAAGAYTTTAQVDAAAWPANAG